MYNAGKIIIGLIVFVALVMSAFFYNILTGKAAVPPDVSLDTPVIKQLQEKACVEPALYMRASHMQLLDEWRDDVVRNARRIYVASNGKRWNMSLTNTCLECHSNKEKFCNTCHDYVGVAPTCWTCHVVPEETN
ncbi:MAG: sulfate reduction electron transfer complex DsrMKJOP subunit DsrJ [Planctomycetota bacterium]|jgi:hypothetical protein